MLNREGDCVVKWGTEMKYTFWAVSYVLFNFGILSVSKDTNMEALLSKQPSSMASHPRSGLPPLLQMPPDLQGFNAT